MSWFDSSSMMPRREKLKQNVVCMKYMTGTSSKNYRLGYDRLTGWRDLMERIWKHFMIFSQSQNGIPEIRMTHYALFGTVLSAWLIDAGKVWKIVQAGIGNWFCIGWQAQVKRSTTLRHSASTRNKRRGNVILNIGKSLCYLYCAGWMTRVKSMELNILRVNWVHWV